MRRHRLDLLSLFFGLCFVAIGGVFISGEIDVTDVDWDVTWPLPLIAAGLLMLAAALRGMSQSRDRYEPQVAQPEGMRPDEVQPDEVQPDEVQPEMSEPDAGERHTGEAEMPEEDPPDSVGERRPPLP
jgi:Domain of unknown function (DUF5668)